MFQKTHFRAKNTYSQNSEGLKTYPMQIEQKEPMVAILMSDKDFKTKSIKRQSMAIYNEKGAIQE